MRLTLIVAAGLAPLGSPCMGQTDPSGAASTSPLATAVPEPLPVKPVAPTPSPGSLAVDVTLKQADGKTVPAVDAVVWLEGGSTRPDSTASADRPRIAQRHKRFEPHVEVVSVGTTVAFPNFDKVYHNVFSLSDIATFDLGLYRNGASRSVTFTRPGVVRIYCNIHPHMTAFLVVVPSRFTGKTDASGVAHIRGIPPGRYDLKLWHETTDEATSKVTVGAGLAGTIRVSLDASHYRLLPHKNKYGKEYPPPDDDEDRY